jgi:hypothetical protein
LENGQTLTVTEDMHVVVAIRVSPGKLQSPVTQLLMPDAPARSKQGEVQLDQ